MTFPQFAVSRWIGHSITISGKHYANAVPDELFERAAKATACAQRQAQRKASDGAGKERKQANGAEGAEARNSAANLQGWRDLRLVSASPGVSEEWSRGELNPRPETVSTPLLRVCRTICFRSLGGRPRPTRRPIPQHFLAADPWGHRSPPA